MCAGAWDGYDAYRRSGPRTGAAQAAARRRGGAAHCPRAAHAGGRAERRLHQWVAGGGGEQAQRAHHRHLATPARSRALVESQCTWRGWPEAGRAMPTTQWSVVGRASCVAGGGPRGRRQQQRAITAAHSRGGVWRAACAGEPQSRRIGGDEDPFRNGRWLGWRMCHACRVMLGRAGYGEEQSRTIRQQGHRSSRGAK